MVGSAGRFSKRSAIRHIGSFGTQQGQSTWPYVQDQNGDILNQSTAASGVWQTRRVILDQFAGQNVSVIRLTTMGVPPPGVVWDLYYRDVVIVSADGTFHPIYTGEMHPSFYQHGVQGEVDLSASVGNIANGPTDSAGTHFYLGDHLGTAQMEFASGGWPVWQGQFAPFGGELVNGMPIAPTSSDGSTNHYKFTGKERDTESGLDYFGARYYASSMGRWMSPDWADKPEAVPYSSLDNPQSLNLYGYVGNNPLSRADADGHEWPDPPTVANAVDFGIGVLQGAVSSMTWGLAGAPSSSDSLSSLAGQSLGTALSGGAGTSLVGAAGPGELAGLAAAPETAGAGLVVSGAAAVGGLAGAGMAAGAAKNTLAIGVAMSRRAGDFTGSTREGAIKNNAEQNGGTNKCEKCGQDLQSVGNKSGQMPPDNQLHVHHDPPINEGGGKDSKPVVVCRDCHLDDIHKQ